MAKTTASKALQKELQQELTQARERKEVADVALKALKAEWDISSKERQEELQEHLDELKQAVKEARLDLSRATRNKFEGRRVKPRKQRKARGARKIAVVEPVVAQPSVSTQATMQAETATPTGPQPTPAPSDEEINKKIQYLRKDIDGIINFIGSQFAVIAKANAGVIDINHPDFVQATKSLVYSDPRVINSAEAVAARGGKSDVKSFIATKQAAEKVIDKLIAKGANPDKFKSFRKEMEAREEKLKTQLQSKEGVTRLVANMLGKQLVSRSLNVRAKDSKGKVTPISYDQRRAITARITKRVKLNSSGVSVMLAGDGQARKLAEITASSLISEAIGGREKKGTKGRRSYILDESKLTDENITKLGQSVSAVTAHAGIVHEVAVLIAKEKKLEINQARRMKLLKNLAPALSKLGPEYLKANREKVVSTIAKDLSSKSSLWGRLHGELRTSTKSQMKIAKSLLKTSPDLQPTSNKPNFAQRAGSALVHAFKRTMTKGFSGKKGYVVRQEILRAQSVKHGRSR